VTTFQLAHVPGAFAWRNQPLAWQVSPDQGLTITAGPHTDWFIDPAGQDATDSAPSALFRPPDRHFLWSARVQVAFASVFDAGVLVVYVHDALWAKLCFELSPQRHPMIVSVVTRGTSDDCNAAPLAGPAVYLRIARQAHAFAFHYSPDGAWWHLVRYFSFGPVETVRLGLAAQSPTGQHCTVSFSEIRYRQGTVQDIRSGA
jgi:regulation of enolase protein 1 (concanavalin A-like superfamily)